MTIAPPASVRPAVRAPLPYGLFSTFALRPGGDRWESGVQFEVGTCDPAGGIGVAGCEQPEIQILSITGGPTTGTWTLTYDGQTTATIPLASTAATVQSRLEALSNVEAGDVRVTGATNGPYTVTWTEDGARSALVPADTFNTGEVTALVYQQGYDIIGLPKTLTGNAEAFGESTPFTVYGHSTCSPVGNSPAAAQAKANEHLLAREEGRVEQALWTGDLGNTPNFLGATVLGGGAVARSVGLALLENWIGTTYGSTGTIHMTRAAAIVMEDLLVSSGGRLTTLLGTPVAAGGGYPGTGPAGQAITATTSWIYATPALFGYRSEVFTSSASPGDLFDRTSNDLYAVAERSYLLGFDPCGVAAALINLV